MMEPLIWVRNASASQWAHVDVAEPLILAEEVRNASMNVPRSMFFTIFLNGALGFAAFVALLFSIGDVETALSSPTGYPFIQIFYGATKSKAAATVMTSVIVVLAICATIGYVASSSRQLWAFARDRGVPFSSTFAKVRYSMTLQRSTISH